MSGSIIAAIVAITVCTVEGLIGIIRLFIEKFSDRDKKYLSDDQQMQLKSLYDLHTHYDMDGVPLWYVPRSWADSQKQIAEKLVILSETQNKTLDIIERLEKRLDKLPSEG